MSFSAKYIRYPVNSQKVTLNIFERNRILDSKNSIKKNEKVIAISRYCHKFPRETGRNLLKRRVLQIEKTNTANNAKPTSPAHTSTVR